MKSAPARNIETPENQFLEKRPELFRMNLLMPVQFKGDWILFKRRCTQLGLDLEDVLGDLIRQFNAGGISTRRK